MKKYIHFTLGKKFIILYLLIYLTSSYFIHVVGHNYIHEKVIEETKQNLWDAGTTLLNSHINQMTYTKDTIKTMRIQLKMASETSECRIMIICNDGDMVVDTDNINSTYNVYSGDTSFLHTKYTENFTMNNYLGEASLCVSLPMEENPYLNGNLVFAQENSIIDTRTQYYSNILFMLFYLMSGILALTFIIMYLINVKPLKLLCNKANHFSIAHDNPTIKLNSNDEYADLARTLNVIGDELSKFDEYQRKFISNISHDFRSPLTSIRGYVQAMLDGIIPVENQDKYLNIILFETERLTKLTTNLIDLNNFDKDHIFLNISQFDIHDVIHKTEDTLEGMASKKNIEFKTSFASDSPLIVSADLDKIHQVLHNLMDNAVKFSKNNSQIIITTRTKGDKVFVSVKDTGIGIPKEGLAQIWDRFYKTDLSRGKDKLGIGLGLSICKEIINAHKQTIDVVSTEGVGSEFVFTLPKA